MGDFWQSVTGGLESTEIFEEGYFREIREEAGIPKEKIIRVIKDVHHFQFESTVEDMTLIRTEFVRAFEVTHDAVVSLDKNIYVEHTEYRWCSLDEALALLKWDNTKNAIKRAYERIVALDKH